MSASAVQIRVLIVDDHPLLREGVAAIFNNQPDITLIAEAENGREGVEKFREHLPDVALIDLRLPDMSGIDVIIAIRGEFPKAGIIVLTSSEGDAEIARALAAGAKGYLLKGMVRKELSEAIRLVHEGKTSVSKPAAMKIAEHFGDDSLTAREIEVLRLAATGHRNKQIARELDIAEETVKFHIRNTLSKLGANDRTHAVTIALKRGIIHL